MPTVERLTEKDYAEALAVLNTSFSFKETEPDVDLHADFEANLPIMWTREHDYMSKHLAVREAGKIAAMLGVYPLSTVIAGEKVLLGTIGNVATLPSARGKGYMKALVPAALEEAKRIGMVAARLGGLRSRYNRYDFDHAGVVYFAELTQRNVREKANVPVLRFVPIQKEDAQALDFARKCQESAAMYVERETRLDFYCALRAWKNRPLLAVNEQGAPVGYLSVSPAGDAIAEWGVTVEWTAVDLAAAYLAANPDLPGLRFQVAPYDTKTLRAMYLTCESWTAKSSSMFHVFQWDAFLRPLMKLALESRGLPEGSLAVEIQGWGTVQLRVKGKEAFAEKTALPAAISLTPLEATHWFLGDVPALQPISAARPEAAWFPLPLSWNGQDRV